MRLPALMHRLPVTALVCTVALAAYITPASAQVVTINGDYLVDDVTHATSQVFSQIVVGHNANATLTIHDGRLVGATTGPDAMTLGRALTSALSSVTAVVNVIGNQSRLQVNANLDIARNFNASRTVTGILNVGAGGHARVQEVAFSFGNFPCESIVTVSGPGSLFETVTTLSMRQVTSPSRVSTLRIEPGGTVSVGTTIAVTGSPDIILDGGTLSLTDPSALPVSGIIQFNSGALRFRSSQTLAAGPGFLTDFYGSPPVFGTDRGLVIDGTTTLATSLLLDGGSLSTARIAVNPSTGSLVLNGGTLTLTGEGAVIDDGGDFGPDPLMVGDGVGAPMLLELDGAGDVLLGAVMVAADGTLDFGGESLIVDSLNNGGSVSIADATLDVRAGLVNTGSLSLADVVVEGGVTSPAGAKIDVAGTVVFNGDYTGAAAFYGSGTLVFNGTLSVD